MIDDPVPIPLDAIAEWLERHPEVASITITEEIEEWYE